METNVTLSPASLLLRKMEQIAAGATTTLRYCPVDSSAIEGLKAKRREAIAIAAAIAFTQQNGAAGDFDTYFLNVERTVNARSVRNERIKREGGAK